MSDQQLEMILKALSEFKNNFDDFKKENKEHLTRIEETVLRVEESQPDDIKAMLETINRKLEDRDYELQALNN
ncbi:hypothetical protein [Metabacillus arenae]|uniref:Uncharacterized protein n=1 Tax=Metabacillus arenae TaxID=2771434 RepID=A0A926RY34_9BACI|nr:hypothetical protein [Metabacillus arenae]MBD1381631.1 hypothetical protein [Metabacillus arenae]